MRDIVNRLERLEQRSQAARGVRIFQQDHDDASIYFESVDTARDAARGLPWSKEEIAELGRQGWQCIVVEYVDAAEWRQTLPGDEYEEEDEEEL